MPPLVSGRNQSPQPGCTRSCGRRANTARTLPAAQPSPEAPAANRGATRADCGSPGAAARNGAIRCTSDRYVAMSSAPGPSGRTGSNGSVCNATLATALSSKPAPRRFHGYGGPQHPLSEPPVGRPGVGGRAYMPIGLPADLLPHSATRRLAHTQATMQATQGVRLQARCHGLIAAAAPWLTAATRLERLGAKPFWESGQRLLLACHLHLGKGQPLQAHASPPPTPPNRAPRYAL